MSSNAIPAQGTEIKIGSGSPITYTKIKEVKTFTGPGGSAAVIDVTDLSSAAKEKRMGLQDEGELSFTMNYLPEDTQHILLRTQRASGDVTPFQILLADSGATTLTFDALVKGFSLQGGVDGVIEATVSLEITGDVVVA